MKRHLKNLTCLLTAATLLLGTSGCGKPSKLYTVDDIILPGSGAWINEDPYYDNLRKTLNLNSYSVSSCHGSYLVATDDTILYAYCENAYEIDGTTPVSLYTTYDIASSSKTITAAAVLLLVDDGLISLEDTIDRFFPGYEDGSRITVSHLLHMQSGIPDYLNRPDEFFRIDEFDDFSGTFFSDGISDEEFLDSLNTTQLDFEPGTNMRYSNTNYHLLAMIVENVSGKRFCDFLQERIFDPCGMTHTSSMTAGDETAAPTGYTVEQMSEMGATDENGFSMQPNTERGDGGIHTCCADLLLFDRALFGGKLLSSDSFNEMINMEMEYGCGLMPMGPTSYQHDGSGFCFSSTHQMIYTADYGYIYVIDLEHK